MSKQTVEDLIEERGGGTGYHDIMKTTGELQGVFKDQNITSARRAYLNILCHKMARLIHGYGDDDDNLLDIAGYSELERREIPAKKREIFESCIKNGIISDVLVADSLDPLRCKTCQKWIIPTWPKSAMCSCGKGDANE